MLALDSLSVATYKGVRFPCNTTRTTVGRAKIKHQFANSDKNNIEDQGLNPRIYELTAIITGENYESDRDQLLAAIESPEPGVLVHTFYGRVENAVAMPVSYDEVLSRLGSIEIPITFEISESEGIPAVSKISSSGIAVLKDALVVASKEHLSDTFSVSIGLLGNFEAARQKITQFIDTIKNSIPAAATNLGSEYQSQLDTFTRNINELIGDPVTLSESVTELVNDISGLYETPEQTLDAVTALLNFGDDDTPIVATTVGLSERLANNTAMNNVIKSVALGVSYVSASLIDYRTVDDVDIVSRSLELAHRSLRGGMSLDSLNALDEIRISTQILLGEQKLSAARVVTVNRHTRSASLLSFDYYGNSENAQSLIDINNNINVSYFEGDVGILTE